ncbi:hypothetical protein EST38_g3875 [Candolleomyces aberdarensis]|uniref:Uncharacterized protein n=1 Tax=Candolleomyces aberdarensis TaxID=2316362 RepID=A0A4Q2DPB3_9AGAR|nr:hypothetical protein EST38_g3875 [Candolleomyces aberdarensis]
MTTGPPPSSFNYPGSASSSKRNSLPASPSQGPRPLHLLDLAGSVVQNSGSPTTASQSILSPTRLSVSGTNSPVLSPSPLGKELIAASASSGAGSSAPQSQPQSRSSGTPKNLKRQSAISYFAPDHDGLREKELLLKRTSSPLHATSGTSVASLSSPRNASGNTGVEGASSRPASIIISVDEKDRPPITLAEKHAELLHFIAQKEAKCLELRSQLAVHEEELLQLKRKWERIVNRGLERENSSTSSPSSSNLYSSNNSSNGLISLTNPALALEGLKEGVQGMSRFLAAGLSITSPSSSSPDNFHSFQSNQSGSAGAARPTMKLGLPSSSKSPLSTSSSPIPPSPLSISSTPLVDSPVEGSGVLGSSSGVGRGPGGGFVKHAANESNSSSATTGTSTVFSAGSGSTSARHRLSMRSSRCSSESATSLEEDEGVHGLDASSTLKDKLASEGERQRQQKDHGSPQELMVSDTGSTPTVSPNPAWLEQKARRRRRQQQQQEEAERESQLHQPPPLQGGLGITSRSKGADETSSLSDVSWDAWGDEDDEGAVGTADGQRHDRGTTSGLEKKNGNWLQDPPKVRNSAKRASVNGSATFTTGPTSAAATASTSPNAATSVLASSIPTFGAAAESIAGLSALASPQMSSWMGSVGKKIGGEMKKSSDALTRSQKRASLMLSDMSQSLVSALTAPPSAPSGASSSLAASGVTPSSTPSPVPDKTFGLVSPIPRVSSKPSVRQGGGAGNHSSSLSLSATLSKNLSGAGSSSLLDDDDDDGFGPFLENPTASRTTAKGMQVMAPDVKVTTSGAQAGTTKSKSRKSAGGAEDDEDEWNW